MDTCNIMVRHLNQSYGKKQVLTDINLTIEKGMFGLLGRNGAGKTTFMKTLATLLPKKEGSVILCGYPVEKAAEVRRIVGYLPQDFSFYPSMTVAAAMDYLGVLSGVPKAKRMERSNMLLHKVNLADAAGTKVRALSGGMRRRLGIAAALLHDPQVLIVDEPTAGLDPEERIRFRNLLCELAEERIVLLSTHIVGDIEATCEKLAILNDGQLLYNGSVNDLLKSAAGHVYTATVPHAMVPAIKKKHYVTGMLTVGDQVTLRILANEKPLPDATPCAPDIEDAYMHCLSQHGCILGGDIL